ncbi:cadmium-translocating P-type ATPase [Solihabitans fulvus]|uniref:Cadmium-translocating P-type ATPase n=1 Tax=Solihabitans fulvus TaxID=1892852 RepID=A0A5B2XF01_9PSEU|nr:heavy metal translocating P-type ATPase [Solihabitans fulvus]KAA2261836.1 cadmium-translocating P-type ATPase [Solihabitans fulvus]
MGHTTDRTPVNGELVMLVLVTQLLVAGGVLWLTGAPFYDLLWGLAAAFALGPTLVWVGKDLRSGRLGADLLAVLALAGTLLVGERLAGAVIAVMVLSGHALDTYARRRARRDLSALLDRAPRHASVWINNRLRRVKVGDIAPTDRLVVAPGEVVPVDGTLLAEGSFDESALTGEPAIVTRAQGEFVRSGVVNAGGAVQLMATATERDSTYAGIVRLASGVAAESAPVLRLADQFAVVFLPVALVVAALAAWLSHDVGRAVAVLVTATPCPLLLAAPVAITSGMSRASRLGVVLRDGLALETLGHATIMLLDKTGTVTTGRPAVSAVLTAPDWAAADVLELAASVEQQSVHVLADAVVRAAHDAGLRPPEPHHVLEQPGFGASGAVRHHQVAVGRLRTPTRDLSDWAVRATRRAEEQGAALIWVEIDDRPVGALLATDELRPDAADTVRRLRAAGLRRLVLLTGDRADTARRVADALGLDEAVADCTPADKVERTRAEQRAGTTVMVGDGVNDAPALAAADVGIALGTRATTAAVQAADGVITDDRIGRLADVMDVARRARRIAVQSAGIGMGLSLVAMLAAALGLLPPVAGAIAQEGIDLAVILNALRALAPAHPHPQPAPQRHATPVQEAAR